MRFCVLDTWHHTGYYTSCCKASFQMHFNACSQVCSEVHSWLHSMAHSQPAWLHAPKYTPSTLPSTPPSTFSSTLPCMHSRMHPVALDGTLPACLTVRSQASPQDALKHTAEHALKYTRNCTRWHTPSLLDCTLPSKISRYSQVHLQVPLKYAPNCTRWYTPSLHAAMPPSTLSREKTLPMSLDYMLPCMLLHAGSRDLLSCRHQAPGGVRLVVYGMQCLVGDEWRVAGGRRHILAEVKTLVDIIVWTLSWARPLWQDLRMPQTHGVDIFRLRFRRKGRQLDLRESRSLTQIFQRDLVPASHRLWVYVCAFGPGLMGMMAMVIAMALVMVLAIVIIVPEVLIQVGWLRQRHHQTFHRPRAFYLPKLPQTQSFPSAKASRGKLYSSCMLDPETCWVAHTRHPEAEGRWRMASSIWWVVYGM